MEGKIIQKNGEIVEVYGYKVFAPGLVGRQNFQFEVGKQYHENHVSFGSQGFHFCLRLEDTLCSPVHREFCLVRGFGKIQSYDDDYYGYYDMFCCSDIEIIKKISREEILTAYSKMKDDYFKKARYERFKHGFLFTQEELEKYNFLTPKKKVKSLR